MNWTYESKFLEPSGRSALPNIENYLVREDGYPVRILILRDSWHFRLNYCGHEIEFFAPSSGVSPYKHLNDVCILYPVSQLNVLKSFSTEEKYLIVDFILDLLDHVYLVPSMKGKRVSSVQFSPLIEEALAIRKA